MLQDSRMLSRVGPVMIESLIPGSESLGQPSHALG